MECIMIPVPEYNLYGRHLLTTNQRIKRKRQYMK